MDYKARVFYSLLSLAVLTASADARAAVSHFYGGTQVIAGTGYLYADGVATDAAGNLYVAGTFDGHNGAGGTTDFNPGPGADARTPVGYDAYVSKHGPDGAYGWTAVFSSAAPDYVRIDAVAADGSGVYVTGLFSGSTDFGPGAGGRVLQSVGGPNRFVAKLTPGGATAWVRSNGVIETAGTGLAGTVTAAGGGVYVSGVVDSGGQAVNFGFTDGQDVMTPRGSPAAYISRLGGDGSYGWTRVLNGAAAGGRSHVVDVRPAPGGGIDVLASFAGNLILDPASKTGTVRAVTPRCAFHELVTQFMPDGSYAGWVWPLSPDYNAFAPDAAGNLYLAGPFQQNREYNTFNCNGRFHGPRTVYTHNAGSAVITRLNADATYGWTRPFWSTPGDAGGTGEGQYLLIDSTGAAYVAGSTPDPATGMVSTEPVFLARFSTQGAMSWLRSFGGGSVRGAAIDARNTIYVAGEFQHAAAFDPDGAGDIETPEGFSSVYLSDFYFNPDNTAPVAHDSSIATPENIGTTGTVGAGDNEHDALTYVLASAAKYGVVAITDTTTGAYSYRPRGGFNGTDSFTFVANDGQYDSNVGTVTVTVEKPVPGVDLRMTALDVPSASGAGTRILVLPTLTNAGIDDSSRARVGVYLSTDAQITTADRYLGFSYYPALIPNGSRRAVLDVRIPDVPAGHYYIGAIADDLGQVAESNEDNNTIATPFTVSAPDLTITGIHAPAGALARGSIVQFTVDIKNVGNDVARPSRLALVLSTDARIDTGDTLLRTTTAPMLAPGAAASVTLRAPIPRRVAAGAYDIGAIADYAGLVNESNEDNNTGALPVTVGP